VLTSDRSIAHGVAAVRGHRRLAECSAVAGTRALRILNAFSLSERFRRGLARQISRISRPLADATRTISRTTTLLLGHRAGSEGPTMSFQGRAHGIPSGGLSIVVNRSRSRVGFTVPMGHFSLIRRILSPLARPSRLGAGRRCDGCLDQSFVRRAS
jgi:hypothetical protein